MAIHRTSRSRFGPGVATSLAATPSGSQVTLTWEAPSSNGAAAITRYEYRHVFGTPRSLGALAWTEVGTALTVTVTGLINGREYTFEVRAVNSEGEGSPASIQATPVGAGPLTALSVSPGTPSGGHRPGSLSPAFSSSTYEYTVSVLHSDTHLTFEATTETGYGKQLRIVGDLGYGEFWYGARDMGSSVPGHQVRLSYGVNWFRYAVHTGPDGTMEYHYDIRVTRPYPPLEITATSSYSRSGSTQKTHVENRTEPIEKYRAVGPGRVGENQVWSLSGDDSDDFTLVSETVRHSEWLSLPSFLGSDTGSSFEYPSIRFSQAPDHENPTDSDTDNVYEVTVQVSEGEEMASFNATVTVSDVTDDPGVPVYWLGVWDGGVDDPPLAPGSVLAITEGESMNLSVRPRYAPRQVSPDFRVLTSISDGTKFVDSTSIVTWSTGGSAWQAWHPYNFNAPEDDDTDNGTVTLTFRDVDGSYSYDTMEFTVNITDNDDVGGL